MISKLAITCLLLALSSSGAQFTCTFTGSTDKDGCVGATDGDDHCVWCGFSSSSFGMCVSENQAESLEQKVPGVSCDRYGGDDDAKPPESDDKVVPPSTDDKIPDDFWTCLQKKNAKECTKEDCTWCDTKGGFGVCMTGPAATSASNSSWFTCKNETDVEEAESVSTSLRGAEPVVDPYDSSCILAFLQDQTEAGCTSASDEDGKSCEWCSVAGMANVCLTADQASMGAPLGISCDDRTVEKVGTPYDLACALVSLKDNSKEACVSAVDSDGTGCELCSMQGSFDICLNQEQASLAEQIGLDCGDGVRAAVTAKTEDPYDTSCLMAFLQEPTKDGCVAAVDADGDACEFCSLQSFSLCLTPEQAGYGEQLGITCETASSPVVAIKL